MANPISSDTIPTSISSLGKDTILTEKVYPKEDKIDELIHLDMFTGSFLTGVVLTVICIVYLFKSNTEYLCWIFGIVLLVLLPITWLGDFMKSSNSKYKWYISICLFFGIILNFAAILMVVLYTTRLQNRIREYKSNEVLKPGQKPQEFHINPNILDNYRIIKILFTTNLVLCITIIMNFFVHEGETKSAVKAKIEPIMARNMYWWYKLVHDLFIRIDQFIINVLKRFPFHGFVKMFLLFCAGFLFFFFSFFVRLKTTYKNPTISDPYVQNLIKEFGYGLNNVYPVNNFDIVNFPDILVETAGPVNFAALSSFFLAFAFTMILSLFSLLIPNAKEFTKNLNVMFLSFILCILITFMVLVFVYGGIAGVAFLISFILFGVFYVFKLGFGLTLCVLFTLNFLILYFGNLGDSKDMSANNKTSQNYILFCLCFLFSLVGTPVVFMVFELLGRIIGVSLSGDLKAYFFPNSTTKKCEKMCIYRNIFSLLLLAASFLGLLFGIFSYGTSFGKPENQKTWMSGNGNNSQVKIFVITIMSIMVGWFFALHLKFNMFSFVYESVIQPSRFVLFVFAPLTVLALAITQIIIASISSKLVGQPIKTDG